VEGGLQRISLGFAASDVYFHNNQAEKRDDQKERRWQQIITQTLRVTNLIFAAPFLGHSFVVVTNTRRKPQMLAQRCSTKNTTSEPHHSVLARNLHITQGITCEVDKYLRRTFLSTVPTKFLFHPLSDCFESCCPFLL
jgi:hypothetical protein